MEMSDGHENAIASGVVTGKNETTFDKNVCNSTKQVMLILQT
jgi:hypothetical protein